MCSAGARAVDVFRRGQGVFGIAVGPVQAELEGEILSLFPEEPVITAAPDAVATQEA